MGLFNAIIVTLLGLFVSYHIRRVIYINAYISENRWQLASMAKEFKKKRTLYSARAALSRSYPSKYNYKGIWSRGTGICTVMVKEEGLLFKIYLSNTFALKFEHIYKITLKEDKKSMSMGQYLIIESYEENIISELVFATNKDLPLLDIIREHYKGDMIGY